MTDDLNVIKIPLADLRVKVVQLMKDGHTEYPLGDFLHILKDLTRKEGDANRAAKAGPEV